MDQPKIPTLKDSQKPQMKIKGLAAGMSLFDRLKQFKKKDLAFILAGLGTLFMAPLAEHFMMAPENGADTMQAGWGGKGAGNLFNNGGSPYESGITGLAPGGAIGGGGDVITPLNVRDPSALVMGPGAQQQPPAGSMAPQTPPPAARQEPDLKDALANAAARAAGAATRRAPVPVPKPGISGSGLRGLGVISGGSSAGAGLGAISSNNLAPRGAAGSNSLGDVRPSTGYRGVAGGRGPGKGGGGFEDLKRGAGSAGDLFNQRGAGGALETAAAQQMGGGSAFGGAGGGGAGGNDKGPGGSNTPGSKSVGESLEFLRQKQEMEKALDLKWKMKEKKTMFPIELAQEATKTAVMKGVVEPLSGMMGDLLKSSFGPDSRQVFQCREGNVPVSEVSMTGDRGCAGKKYFQITADGGLGLARCGSGQAAGGERPVYSGCRLASVGGTQPPAGPGANDQLGQGQIPPMGNPPTTPLSSLCEWLNVPTAPADMKQRAVTVNAVINRMQPGSGVSCTIGGASSSYTDTAPAPAPEITKAQADEWAKLRINADGLKEQFAVPATKYAPLKTAVDTKLAATVTDATKLKTDALAIVGSPDAAQVKQLAEPYLTHGPVYRTPQAANAVVTEKGLIALEAEVRNALDTAQTGLKARVAAANTALSGMTAQIDLSRIPQENRQVAQARVAELEQWRQTAIRAVAQVTQNNTRIEAQLATLKDTIIPKGKEVHTQIRDSIHLASDQASVLGMANALMPGVTNVEQLTSATRTKVDTTATAATGLKTAAESWSAALGQMPLQ